MAKKRKVDDDLSTAKEEPDTEVEDDEQEDDSDSEEDLTKLLEPFNKEQLIEILRSAASKNPSVLEEIHRVADLDPSHRKLFVHGLGWETTSEKLREVFAQYGELEDCNVVTDKSTGKSKGYGFLVFRHRTSAQKALKEPQKKIESRMTACQLASSGPVNTSFPQQQNHHHHHHNHQQQNAHANNHSSSQENLQRKIYVGNVHSEIPGDKLLAFFSKYGEIEEGPLGFDKQTGKPKGYALFIYKTLEGAKKALEEPSKNFDGHQLYCQKASENHKNKASPAPGGNVVHGGDGVNAVGGYNGPVGMGFNAPNGAMGYQPMVAPTALLGQGFIGGHQQFGQSIPQIQAALAVLAAAGQNPAAFGVSPGVASLNPALGGSPAMQQAMSGYGMSNTGYQNPQGHQANMPYHAAQTGQAPTTRPPGMGPMGGYATR